MRKVAWFSAGIVVIVMQLCSCSGVPVLEARVNVENSQPVVVEHETGDITIISPWLVWLSVNGLEFPLLAVISIDTVTDTVTFSLRFPLFPMIPIIEYEIPLGVDIGPFKFEPLESGVGCDFWMDCA